MSSAGGRPGRSAGEAEVGISSVAPRPPLKVRDLVKSYGTGAPPAVDGLSFDVAAGEVLGLLGPNGAGKSTTVACIAGLLSADSGSIELSGVDMARAPKAVLRHLGLATQDIALYTDLTVQENVVHFGRLAGLSAADMSPALRRISDLLGLDERLGRRVRDLSGGQQRIVHVACAAVHRPSLLVLDEPTAGLDARARAMVMDLVADARSAGGGVLYSSHYLHEVEDLCDRIVIIGRGRVIAHGSVSDVVARHGSSSVEVEIDGVVHTRSGLDVSAVVAELAELGSIDDIRVRRPTLEAVFLDLTGSDEEVAGP